MKRGVEKDFKTMQYRLKSRLKGIRRKGIVALQHPNRYPCSGFRHITARDFHVVK